MIWRPIWSPERLPAAAVPREQRQRRLPQRWIALFGVIPPRVVSGFPALGNNRIVRARIAFDAAEGRSADLRAVYGVLYAAK